MHLNQPKILCKRYYDACELEEIEKDSKAHRKEYKKEWKKQNETKVFIFLKHLY